MIIVARRPKPECRRPDTAAPVTSACAARWGGWQFWYSGSFPPTTQRLPNPHRDLSKPFARQPPTAALLCDSITQDCMPAQTSDCDCSCAKTGGTPSLGKAPGGVGQSPNLIGEGPRLSFPLEGIIHGRCATRSSLDLSHPTLPARTPLSPSSIGTTSRLLCPASNRGPREAYNRCG